MFVLFEFMKVDFLQYCKEFIECFDVLRRDECFCDVIVVVKGKEFKIYKIVLVVVSFFFFVFFESDMRESNEQLISIEFEQVIFFVMDEVLKYIYIGNVLVIKKISYNLIVIVDYFFLLGLKIFVGNFMKENLIIENCIFNCYFVDKYQCFELREGVCEKIIINFSVVMEIGDFLNFDIK